MGRVRHDHVRLGDRGHHARLRGLHLAALYLGADHLALRIRTVAAEHGVAVVPDPPLARALYASVEVGRMIPEALFESVAQLLAYVYRVAATARTAA